MTDQEKLSGQLTQLDISGKPSINNEPWILELTDLNGNFISPGSTVVEVHDFLLRGVVNPFSTFTIFDGEKYINSGASDDTGHFTAEVANQPAGEHAYTVRDDIGRESANWPIAIIGADQLLIESVTGTDGQLIENGSSTVHSHLKFVGRAAHGKVVELLDNGIVLRLLNVDVSGHWSAELTGLKPGSHKFIARELNGKESAPWHVEIEKSALLSIQFGYGQGNYQPINDGETTTQTTVVLVGTAKPYEYGRILSDAHEVVDFEADQHGVFVALINDLLPGFSYTFVCRSAADRHSAPWKIKVVSSKLPPR